MSVYPYITSAGTDKYRQSILNISAATETLNQFEQAEVINVGSVSAGGGGETLVNPDGEIKTLSQGTGIVLTSTTDNIQIATNTTLADAAGAIGTQTLIAPSSANPNFRLKRLITGTNLTGSTTSTDITLNVNGVVTSVSAGSNITVTGTATAPIINATGAGFTTITSEAGGETVLSDDVGPDFRTKALVEGEGIELVSDATTITVNNLSFYQPVTFYLQKTGAYTPPTFTAQDIWHVMGFTSSTGPAGIAIAATATPANNPFTPLNDTDTIEYFLCTAADWYKFDLDFTFGSVSGNSCDVAFGLFQTTLASDGNLWLPFGNSFGQIRITDTEIATYHRTFYHLVPTNTKFCVAFVITANSAGLQFGPSAWYGGTIAPPDGGTPPLSFDVATLSIARVRNF